MLTAPYNNPVNVSEVRILRDSWRNWSEFCQKKRGKKKGFWSCCCFVFQILPKNNYSNDSAERKLLISVVCFPTELLWHCFYLPVNVTNIALTLTQNCVTVMFCNIWNVNHFTLTSGSTNHLEHLYNRVLFKRGTLQSTSLWSLQFFFVETVREVLIQLSGTFWNWS